MVCILVLTVPSYASPLLQSATPKNTVEGIVVDQNGAAVKGAEITVSAHSFIARGETDASGQFHFNAPQGVIELTVKALGFARVERKLKPATEDITQLRIILAPASITEQLTITATRVKTRLSETAASVVVLDSQGLKTTAAPTLDDALRQVPGFTLFRRSGSRTANPTSQGISLRGLGASGASRAVVLVDGVPLNDPFGGWVYWDRIPRESLSQVEILRGGSPIWQCGAEWRHKRYYETCRKIFAIAGNFLW
jgi:outer membrane receptor protein involved in Fe transport